VSKVLVPKRSAIAEGYPLGYILRRMGTPGDIGIEIECEGNKFPKADYTQYSGSTVNIPKPWTYHHDGSLRGADNAEYVLANPVKFSAVAGHLDDLKATLDKFGTVLDESNRTSVHVHLNFQNFHLNRLAAFCSLYFAMEEILTAWCGEHRVGNLFCLRAKDAPAIVTKIRRFIEDDGNRPLADGLHYSGLNVHALAKYGSVEVRTLRGCQDFNVIKDWVRILQRLYEVSADYPDPRGVISGFSGQGALTWFQTVLGDCGPIVRQGVPFSDQELTDMLYEGIRMAQDICYCRDWSFYKPVEVKADPFGRVPKRRKTKKAKAPNPFIGNIPEELQAHLIMDINEDGEVGVAPANTGIIFNAPPLNLDTHPEFDDPEEEDAYWDMIEEQEAIQAEAQTIAQQAATQSLNQWQPQAPNPVPFHTVNFADIVPE
jgi:hypothetical protein